MSELIDNPAGEIRTKLRSELAPYVDSRHPIILAVADEEERFLRAEESVLVQTQRISGMYVWDYNGKLIDRKTGHETVFQNPRDVIEWFAKEYTGPAPTKPGQVVQQNTNATSTDLKVIGPRQNSVLVLLDVMYHMQDAQGVGYSNPGLTRVIKKVQSALVKNQRNLVMVSHRDFVPPELQHHVAVVKYPLPDRDYMQSLVRMGCKWFGTKEKPADQSQWLILTQDEEISIATLLLGFRGWEAENVLARAAHENKRRRAANPEANIPKAYEIDVIREAKVETIRSNPALNIVIPKGIAQEGAGVDMIGGAGSLKNWFTVRRRLFSEEARLDGIDQPKGAVIFGPGGTGKDWAIEHLAESIGWTTLYADLGAAKTKWQGESHRNFREIISAAEAQAPCFFVISEWEKMMAAAFAGGGGTVGSDTNAEIFATFLNWMQRRTAQVFVWAVTNSMDGIPQAALRAGRWDKLWFMDLPKDWEREDILRIHLKRTGWDPVKYEIDIPHIATLTDGYTGAEIRNVVNEALVLKFIHEGSKSKGINLTTAHLVEAVPLVTPSIKLRKEEIESLRKYAKDGCIESANTASRNAADNPSGRQQKLGQAVADLL